MKTITTRLLSLSICLLTVFNVSAFDFEVDGNYYSFVDDGVEVSKGTFVYIGDVVIPEAVSYEGKTYTVVAVGEQAFSGSKYLTSVTLPETVKRIKAQAFQYDYELKDVNFSSSLTTIGEQAFGQTSISKAILPEGLKEIDAGAFYGCQSLAELSLPNSLLSVGNDAFYGCASLAEIKLPEREVKYGTGVFSGCESVKSLVIPAQLTVVPARMFSGCKSLSQLTISEGVKVLEDDCFKGNELSEIVFPSTLEKLGSSFSGSGKITSFPELPKTMTEIPAGMLKDCINVKSYTIPAQVTAIGEEAFFACGLEYIEIPETVKVLGSGCFAASKLKTLKLPESDFEMGKEIFFNCPDIEEIRLPSTVRKTPYNFAKFSNVKTVILGPNVELISSGSFAFCMQLTDVYSYAMTPPEMVQLDAHYNNAQFEGTILQNATLHIPAGTLRAYLSVTYLNYWKNFGNILEDLPPYTSIEDIEAEDPEEDGPADVYNLQGVKVMHGASRDDVNTLPTGLYILSTQRGTKKIAVK